MQMKFIACKVSATLLLWKASDLNRGFLDAVNKQRADSVSATILASLPQPQSKKVCDLVAVWHQLSHRGCHGPQSVTPQCLWHPPTKWLMRSNDELHSQFNPGAWEFIHRTDCRGYGSPNPGHLWSSKSPFPSCLIINWRAEWKTCRGNMKTKDLLKSAKKKISPSYNYPQCCN